MASEYNTVQQERAEVGSGLMLPLVGLGTWLSKAGEVEKAVVHAIKAGYRHIDCARIYGNEKEVGAALAQVFKDGIVQRSDLWVTSKLWNDSHAAADVEPACRATLADLGLEQLDLYLVHWPVTTTWGPELTPPIRETWQAMESLVDKGLVRAIGVSNFSGKKLGDLLGYARIKPTVNQVEAHPYWRNDALLDFCRSRGVHLSAYSPLGSPGSAAQLGREKEAVLLEDETVKAIAAKLGKSPGQVLLRWGVQRGTSVLPKSVSPARIEQNFDVFTWALPEEDFKALSQLSHQQRSVDGSFWVKPEGPYTAVQQLWDE